MSTGACSGTHADTAPVNSVAAAPSGAPGLFGGTDLAWVEINLAMDEQLLPLLDLAPANSTNPDVKALVTQVKVFHEQELAAAAPEDPPRAGREPGGQRDEGRHRAADGGAGQAGAHQPRRIPCAGRITRQTLIRRAARADFRVLLPPYENGVFRGVRNRPDAAEDDARKATAVGNSR